jgi:hypothetical protein
MGHGSLFGVLLNREGKGDDTIDKIKATAQPFLKLLMSLCVLAVLAWSLPASAEVVLPKKGMRYFTWGLSLNPGVVFDDGNSQRESSSAFSTAGMADLGITQVINRNFFMSAEARLGIQWMDSHTATLDGQPTAASNSLAWQLGLNGHWLPLGEDVGLMGAAGLHLFRAHLDEASLQVLGAEMRLGKYIWGEDEQFLLLQIGYSAPFIQGLSRPQDFSGEAERTERTWSFHRFMLGFQYGF